MNEEYTEIRIAREASFFPSLKDAAGVWPWNPELLDKWANEDIRTEAEKNSARFILNLWEPANQWKSGSFDPKRAIESWDLVHRKAFMDIKTVNVIMRS